MGSGKVKKKGTGRSQELFNEDPENIKIWLENGRWENHDLYPISLEDDSARII